MGRLLNQRELAEDFGVSVQTIQKWQEKEDFPKYSKKGENGKANTYDITAIINWKIKQSKKESVSEYQIERTRLAKTQADKNEYEIELLRKNIVRYEDINLIFKSIAIHFRSSLSSFTTKLVPQLEQCQNNSERSAIIQKEVDNILNYVSHNPPEIKDDNS
jgi:phage terminase Nu1 subunit (DNA packaging protein)